MIRYAAGALVLAALASDPVAGAAGSAGTEQAARDVIDRMEQLYRGDASSATIRMQVVTPEYERELTLDTWSLGRELAFFRITAPRKDRGIATLKRDQEMWNYFPRINKVIKVPPSMMMGSWMGSDFTNDDLVKETTLVDTYHLALVETATEYHITLTPKADTVTVWGRIDYIVSREPLLPVAELFYDDNGALVRRLEFSEPREFDGRLMPSVLEMIPLGKQGHRTRVVYDRIRFDPDDVDDDLFTLRNLQSRF